MEAVISSGLMLLSQIAPSLTGNAAIVSAIKFLSAVLVPGIKLINDEIPVVKGIIETLRGNKAVTADQMAELDKLDERCDAILDESLKAAEAEDAQPET